MLNYGFANYENTVFMDTQTEIQNNVEVKKGKVSEAVLKLDTPLVSFAKRGETNGYEVKYELPETIKAPLKVGDKVGKAYLVKDGEVIGESNVIIAKNIEKSTFFDDLRRIFGLHK